MKLLGWEVRGSIPEDIKKFVIIAAPHTSAWDFPLGVLARAYIGRQDIKFVGKKSLFKGPQGWLMRALGGYPVDRSVSQNFVESVVQIFDAHDAFAVALAPEGTRKKVERFKTGFYYIAKGAQVPIFMVTFDYEDKRVTYDPVPFYPTEDAEKDLAYLWNYYVGVKGKIPEWGIFSSDQASPS